EAVYEMSGLGEIGGPEDIVRRSAGAVILFDGLWRIGAEEFRVPAIAPWCAADQRGRHCDVFARSLGPAAKRPPQRPHLLLLQPLELQTDLEPVAAPQRDGLTPVRGEEVLRIEIHEAPEQLMISRVRFGLQRGGDNADRVGHLVSSQRRARDDAERAAATSL